MKKRKLGLSLALALTVSLIGTYTSISAETVDKNQTSEFSVKLEQKLAEKLKSGEITREKYDEIITSIESGEFRNERGKNRKAEKLTDEQKAEFAKKRAGKTENGKLGGFKDGSHKNGTQLTDEQKAEFVKKRVEKSENGKSDDFKGGIHKNGIKLTDEQKAEFSKNNKKFKGERQNED